MKQSLLLATGLSLVLAISPAFGSDLSKATDLFQQQNYEQARSLLEPLARGGDVKALAMLGNIYENGLGVDADRQRAQNLYERGANVGDLTCLNALRELQNQDYRKELVDIKGRIEQGYASAMNRYGVMLEFGQGLERNPTEAFAWYQKAAKAQLPDAYYNLGRAYNFGTGVSQDFGQAEDWYYKAIKEGNTDALFYLGTLYSNNLGADKTTDQNVIAYAWMHNAAKLGNRTAQAIEQRLLIKLDAANMGDSARALASAYERQYLKP